MKKIKISIDILSFILIIVPVFTLLLLIGAYFFDHSLFYPIPSHTVEKMFNNLFGWKMFMVNLIKVVNFTLFIIAIFSLKKNSTLFIKSDFYNKKIIKNFNKVGTIFIFIGITSLIVTLYSKIITPNTIYKNNPFLIKFTNIINLTFDFKNIFSIIIGLFFLLFSKIFENSRILKQENDLTI